MLQYKYALWIVMLIFLVYVYFRAPKCCLYFNLYNFPFFLTIAIRKPRGCNIRWYYNIYINNSVCDSRLHERKFVQGLRNTWQFLLVQLSKITPLRSLSNTLSFVSYTSRKLFPHITNKVVLCKYGSWSLSLSSFFAGCEESA